MVRDKEEVIRLTYHVLRELRPKADKLIKEYLQWKEYIQWAVYRSDLNMADKEICVKAAQDYMKKCKTALEELETISKDRMFRTTPLTDDHIIVIH